MSLERDPSQNQNRHTHSCPDCGGRLLQPVEEEEVAEDVFFVSFRCPECDWGATRALSDADLGSFDQEYDEGARSIKRDLKAMRGGQLYAGENLGVFVTAAQDGTGD